jgi:sulfur carrier protein
VISVCINGSPRTFAPATSIADLIAAMDLTGKRIAIECNGEIVPRGQFAQHRLNDGDKIEVVVAVGGG